MLSSKQAEYFLEIVSSRSITEASKKLFISQPALSQVMKNLESELGFSLFVRGTSPLRLTKEGEKMIPIARSVITFNQSIEAQLKSLADIPTHAFHIGVLYGQAEDIITRILANFVDSHPQVEVSITEAGSRAIQQLLLNRKIDIGIFSGSPSNSSFKYISLKQDSMVLLAAKDSVFAHGRPNGSTIHFDELADQRFVTKPAGTYSRLLLDTLSQLYGIPLNIKYELENLTPLVASLSTLGCVTLMPQSYYKATPALYLNMNYYYIDYSETHYQELLCYHKDLFISDYLADFIQEVLNDRGVGLPPFSGKPPRR